MTAPCGLTEAEVVNRRARGLGNDARLPTSRSLARIVRQNLVTPVHAVLFSVAGLLGVLGLIIDALVTAAPVLFDAVAGTAREVTAKRRLDRLALLVRPSASVVRNGAERSIDPSELVLGDVAVVRRGDQILADGTLVGEGHIEVDESLLTGESEPVPKASGDGVLSGSACVSGVATYEVRAVGRQGFANRLVAEARRYRDERTPLQREVGRVIGAVAVIVIGLAIPLALLIEWQGPDPTPVDALLNIAVLVALVPMGLAVTITLSYLLAAVRLGGRGILIQRLNAVESLSRVDTVCVDKTGTLTTQRLTVSAAIPVGVDHAALERLLGDFAASVAAPDRTSTAIGQAFPGRARVVLEQIAFASDRRWSAIRLADGPQGETLVLGAPDRILPQAIGAARIAPQVRELAAAGRRVLLFARAPADAPLRGSEGPLLPGSLQTLGIVALEEELRTDAATIIDQLTSAGVQVKVLSGDDPVTVAAVAARAGVAGGEAPVSGPELEPLTDDQLADRVSRATILGRIDPSMKQRVVAALRGQGRYVAMVGDGVNDVLAMKRANLSIAMGTGSPATRGIADIVLLSDALGALSIAITTGQRVVNGMRAVLSILLARTIYMLLIIAGATALSLPFPMTPRHNAVLALVTVGLPVLALIAWAPAGPSPRWLLGHALRFAVPAAIAVTAVSLPVYAWLQAGSSPDPEAHTALTTLTSLCGIGLIVVLARAELARPGTRSGATRRPAVLAGAMVALYGAILVVPAIRDVYGLAALSLELTLGITIVAAAWFVGVLLAHERLRSERR